MQLPKWIFDPERHNAYFLIQNGALDAVPLGIIYYDKMFGY